MMQKVYAVNMTVFVCQNECENGGFNGQMMLEWCNIDGLYARQQEFMNAMWSET